MNNSFGPPPPIMGRRYDPAARRREGWTVAILSLIFIEFLLHTFVAPLMSLALSMDSIKAGPNHFSHDKTPNAVAAKVGADLLYALIVPELICLGIAVALAAVIFAFYRSWKNKQWMDP